MTTSPGYQPINSHYTPTSPAYLPTWLGMASVPCSWHITEAVRQNDFSYVGKTEKGSGILQEDLFIVAVRNRSIGMLELLLEKDCPKNSTQITTTAASLLEKEILAWLVEHDFPCDRWIWYALMQPEPRAWDIAAWACTAGLPGYLDDPKVASWFHRFAPPDSYGIAKKKEKK